MSGPDGGFFGQLGHHECEPWLEKIEGTVRFDITDGEDSRHWLLIIRNGRAVVRPEYGSADAVVHADAEVMERLSRGQIRLLPAWLRNDIALEGRLLFVLVLERLLRPPRDDRPLRGSAVRNR